MLIPAHTPTTYLPKRPKRAQSVSVTCHVCGASVRADQLWTLSCGHHICDRCVQEGKLLEHCPPPEGGETHAG